MLARRVIPTLLVCNGRLVKDRRFAGKRIVGHPLQAAKIHQARGVDELCVLDIGATPSGRGPDFRMVEALTECCFMPLTVGGGVRSIEDVRDLLNAGADKVAICTAVDVVSECAAKFGNQAIVAVVDSLQGEVAVRCGKEIYSPSHVPSWAMTLEAHGAGEILLQSIDRDGTMEGYDLDLIRAVSRSVGIPVIASGGCRDYTDMAAAINAGASAVAAGALFQFTDATPKEAARYLAERGYEMRV
jgi:cyclase